jgi:hypothetical protein
MAFQLMIGFIVGFDLQSAHHEFFILMDGQGLPLHPRASLSTIGQKSLTHMRQ